jgi:hypothetical protein
MSCPRWQRRVSDRLDGALSPVRERRLAEHLAGCADCRSYARGLELLQVEAARVQAPSFTSEYGERFLLRLESRLRDGAGHEAGERRRPFWKKPWAWASAGLAVSAAALAGVLILRPVPRSEVYLLSEKDPFSRIFQQFSRSPDMENIWDEALVASIDESFAASDDLSSNPFDDPLLAEGLSAEDMKLLAEDIAADRTE